MKRSLRISFDDETEWAAALEFFRRTAKPTNVRNKELARGDVIVAHAIEVLDRPATPPQSGEGRP